MFCFQGGVASPEEEEDNVQALEIIIKIIIITIIANDVIIIILMMMMCIARKEANVWSANVSKCQLCIKLIGPFGFIRFAA